jgi:hypothetical protein
MAAVIWGRMPRKKLMPEYLLAFVSVGFLFFIALFVGSFFTLAVFTGIVRVTMRVFQNIFRSPPRRRPQHPPHRQVAIPRRVDDF